MIFMSIPNFPQKPWNGLISLTAAKNHGAIMPEDSVKHSPNKTQEWFNSHLKEIEDTHFNI